MRVHLGCLAAVGVTLQLKGVVAPARLIFDRCNHALGNSRQLKLLLRLQNALGAESSFQVQLPSVETPAHSLESCSGTQMFTLGSLQAVPLWIVLYQPVRKPGLKHEFSHTHRVA